MRKPELTIPTLLGILVSIAGLGAGLWLLREPIRSAVFASSETSPNQVRITNVTDSSFTATWVTAKATNGYIQYDSHPDPNQVVSDDRDQELGSMGNYFTHLVTIRGLRPATTYNFRIGSGGQLYSQQGSLYTITTGLSLGPPPAADVAYGQVLTPAKEPAEGAIVYLSLPGAVTQAGLVKSTGSWVIPLSTARSADLTSFAAYDPQTSQVQIQVEGGSTLGTATVVTTTGQDSPVPAISLGQNLDFSDTTQNPTARPEIDSKFTPITESAAILTVDILSPKPGEAINSPQPEIIGRGPAQSEVTITINSPAAITDTVTTDANGRFSYTVPQNLPPGEHTITVSTLIDGVVKQVQRKFTVLAAGESQVPAFTATPSAIIKPRIAMPATASGVPTSGNLTPTLVLLILGMGLITSGVITYKKLA